MRRCDERYGRKIGRHASSHRAVALMTEHWIAFHLLDHDIHHRADVVHYLALLGIAALTSLNL